MSAALMIFLSPLHSRCCSLRAGGRTCGISTHRDTRDRQARSVHRASEIEIRCECSECSEWAELLVAGTTSRSSTFVASMSSKSSFSSLELLSTSAETPSCPMVASPRYTHGLEILETSGSAPVWRLHGELAQAMLVRMY